MRNNRALVAYLGQKVLPIVLARAQHYRALASLIVPKNRGSGLREGTEVSLRAAPRKIRISPVLVLLVVVWFSAWLLRSCS